MGGDPPDPCSPASTCPSHQSLVPGMPGAGSKSQGRTRMWPGLDQLLWSPERVVAGCMAASLVTMAAPTSRIGTLRMTGCTWVGPCTPHATHLISFMFGSAQSLVWPPSGHAGPHPSSPCPVSGGDTCHRQGGCVTLSPPSGLRSGASEPSGLAPPPAGDLSGECRGRGR